MSEQAILVVLGMAIALNAVVTVVLLLVAHRDGQAARAARGRASMSGDGGRRGRGRERSGRRGPTPGAAALSPRRRVIRRVPQGSPPVPLSAARLPARPPRVAELDPYADAATFRPFGNLALLDVRLEDVRPDGAIGDDPGPATGIVDDAEVDGGDPAAEDAGADSAGPALPGRPLRSYPPLPTRRFRVVLPSDPHAHRAIESFLSPAEQPSRNAAAHDREAVRGLGDVAFPADSRGGDR